MQNSNEKFLRKILEKSASLYKHIVLPEGNDSRTIEAARIIAEKKIAKLTILGNAEKITAQLKKNSTDTANISVINPSESDKLEEYASALYEMRKHKGLDLETAREMVMDVIYHATMMVKLDQADGMVAGAAHSSADAIRPALQFIKAASGVKTVSSAFFMAKGEETYLYSDCALIQNPTPEQHADIVLATARTAKQFGIMPKIALLSYSSKGSGSGPDVERMIEAFRIAKERMRSDFDGEYAIDGELQFDAAFVPSIAKSKAPDSPLAGQANVFIFPDLSSGNICYKMTERIAGFSAYGPVLQGLAKPVNDLSRGCSSSDIVATAAITAIQSAPL